MKPQILTVVITKDRPVEQQFALASLLGQPTDVCLVGEPVAARVSNDMRRAFEMQGQRLIVIPICQSLADRNLGLAVAEEAGYPYTFLMDDDNVVPSGYLSSLEQHLKWESDVIAVSGVIQTYASIKEQKYQHWQAARSGRWPYSTGQRVVYRDRTLYFTERVQVLPFEEHPGTIEVDYFVNAWMQRTEHARGLRVRDMGPFGEEIDYTWRIGQHAPPDKKMVVLQNLLMYHFAADEGGTREVKEYGQDQRERASWWVEVAQRMGFSGCNEVVEYQEQRRFEDE